MKLEKRVSKEKGLDIYVIYVNHAEANAAFERMTPFEKAMLHDLRTSKQVSTGLNMNDNSVKAQHETYVVNIDVAQQIYACGFTAPTMFFYVANPKLDSLYLYRAGLDIEYQGPPEYRFPAPTAMELKDHYPDDVWITTNNNRSHVRRKGLFHFTKYDGKHGVSLMVKSDETSQVYEIHREEDQNEANAAGLMYCYIFENNLHELHP